LANLKKFKSARRVIKLKKGDVSSVIFGPREWKKKYGKELKSSYDKALKQAGKRAGKLLPNLEFNVEHPNINSYLNNRLTKVGGLVNETTIGKLRKQLRLAVSKGESIPSIAERISGVYGKARGARAVTIARTEVLSAYNEGSIQSYIQSGVVDRLEWIATNDSRVRDDHKALDGKTVKLGGYFKYPSGGQTKSPGNSGIASQDISCRCVLGPVVGKESLIPNI